MAKSLPNARVVEMVQAPLCKSGDVGPSPTACSGRNESRECCRAVVESVTTLACHASGAGSSPVGPAALRQDADLQPSVGRRVRTTVVVTVTPV